MPLSAPVGALRRLPLSMLARGGGGAGPTPLWSRSARGAAAFPGRPGRAPAPGAPDAGARSPRRFGCPARVSPRGAPFSSSSPRPTTAFPSSSAARAPAAAAPLPLPPAPHSPVLLSEVVEVFRPLSLSTFFDGTLGAGGHSLAVASTHPELTRLVGVDVDPSALREAERRLERAGWDCEVLWGPRLSGAGREGRGAAGQVGGSGEGASSSGIDDVAGAASASGPDDVAGAASASGPDDVGGAASASGPDDGIQAASRKRRAALVRGNHAASLPILREAFAALGGAEAGAQPGSAPPLASTPSAAPCPGTPTPLSGALLDLGVSSMQLDDAQRGFSFRLDGPLDMRMGAARAEEEAGEGGQTPLGAADRSGGPSATDPPPSSSRALSSSSSGVSARALLETAPVASLAELFRSLGDLSPGEARRAAEAVASLRALGPLSSTRPLADALADALGGRRPQAYRRVRGRGQRHPATRVFQAVRIAVNGELRSLAAALPVLAGNLEVGGRLAVISFHSLEDRVVKQVFKELESSAESSQAWQGRVERAEGDKDAEASLRAATSPSARTEESAAAGCSSGAGDASALDRAAPNAPHAAASSPLPFAPLAPTKKDRLRALRAKQRRERAGGAEAGEEEAGRAEASGAGGAAAVGDANDGPGALQFPGAPGSLGSASFTPLASEPPSSSVPFPLASSSSPPSSWSSPPSSGPTLGALLALADESALAGSARAASGSAPSPPPPLASLAPSSPASPLALPAALLGRDPLHSDPWAALASRCAPPSLAGKAFRALTKRPIVPSDDEVDRLPRARSAKLRVLERIA